MSVRFDPLRLLPMPLHRKYRRTSIEVLLLFNWLEFLSNGSNGSSRPVEF